ncbi:MAG: hypothetical protein O6942_03935, partial [Bacteroidetes bacterium]|nr:hypothetical protein [Bacteroidota bacterium]
DSVAADARSVLARSADPLVDAFRSGLRTNFASLLVESFALLALDSPAPFRGDVRSSLVAFRFFDCVRCEPRAFGVAPLREDIFGADALEDDLREREFSVVGVFRFDDRALPTEERLAFARVRLGLDIAFLLRFETLDFEARDLGARDLEARDLEVRGFAAIAFDGRDRFSTRVVRLEPLPFDDFERCASASLGAAAIKSPKTMRKCPVDRNRCS